MRSIAYFIITSASVIGAGAFMPITSSHGSNVRLQSTAAPPERSAPGASYEPAWENRPGLTPSEFMKSDVSKPELIDIWECPLTRWDTEKYVVLNLIFEISYEKSNLLPSTYL